MHDNATLDVQQSLINNQILDSLNIDCLRGIDAFSGKVKPVKLFLSPF